MPWNRWFLIGLVLLGGCSRDAAYYLRKAEAANKVQKPAEASLALKRGLKDFSNHAELHFQLGMTGYRLNDPVETLKAFEAAVRLDPKHLEAKRNLLRLRTASIAAAPAFPKPVVEETEKIAEELAKIPGMEFDANRSLAYIQWKRGLPARAIEHLELAARKSPLPGDTVLLLQQLYWAAGRPNDARQAGEALIAREPAYGPVYQALAVQAMREKDPARAERYLRQRVEKNPRVASYYTELATHYRFVKNIPEAEKTIAALLTAPLAAEGGLLAGGDFLLQAGAGARALEAWRQGLANDKARRLPYFIRITSFLMAAGKTEEAQSITLQALGEFPADPTLRRQKSGFLLNAKGAEERKQGLALLAELAKESPNNEELRLALAYAYSRNGDPVAAQKELAGIIQANPRALEARVALGNMHVRAGNMEAALQLAREVLKAAPGTQAAHEIELAALAGTGRLVEARESLLQLQRKFPKAQGIRRELALMSIQTGKLDAGCDQLQEVHRATPADGRTLTELVRCRLAQRRGADAIRILDAQLQKAPGAAELRQMRAEAKARSGQFAAARTEFEGLAKEFPKFYLPVLHLAELDWAEGKRDAALVKMAEAARLGGESPAMLLALAQRQEAAGKRGEAIQTYRNWLKKDATNPQAMNNLAWALAESGQNLEEAVQLALKAQAAFPDQPDFVDTAGWALLKARRAAEAAKLFQANAAKFPKNPIFRYHLGLAYLAQGDRTAGKRELEAAKAATPSASPLVKEIDEALKRS